MTKWNTCYTQAINDAASEIAERMTGRTEAIVPFTVEVLKSVDVLDGFETRGYRVQWQTEPKAAHIAGIKWIRATIIDAHAMDDEINALTGRIIRGESS